MEGGGSTYFTHTKGTTLHMCHSSDPTTHLVVRDRLGVFDAVSDRVGVRDRVRGDAVMEGEDEGLGVGVRAADRVGRGPSSVWVSHARHSTASK